MGGGYSSFDRKDESQTCWLVEHCGIGSPWSQFTLRRYGTGLAATGVAASVALPRLLRRQLQDWSVQGCGVYLGTSSISFGRQLNSLSSASESELFFGVDIFFGDTTDKASWIWYCGAREWLLQLNKAVLEPLPASAPSQRVVGTQQQWPGRPRYIGDDADSVAAEVAAVPQAVVPTTAAPEPEPQCEGGDISSFEALDPIEHQLSMFFSNADGHVGLLCVPVPRSQVDATTVIVNGWNATCEVPLMWAGRRWQTAEDFAQLRETALNMPDLLLLGLETDLATTLTPDWTWEKYPRGYGDAALPPEAPEEEVFEPAALNGGRAEDTRDFHHVERAPAVA